MKKLLLALLIISLSFSAFAEFTGARTENLYDENLPTQSSPIKPSVAFKPKLGVIWGYDFDRKESGFHEVVDLDVEWEILPYKDYATDTSDLEYGLPYGLVMFSGGHLVLKMQDQTGDMAVHGTGGTTAKKIEPYLSLNFEKIWGKVIWDPFYVVLAANDTNFYERHTGWNFPTSNNFIRANWAHMGNRVQGWVSPLNTDPWTLAGNYDTLKTTTGSAGIGVGYVANVTEVLFQVGSNDVNFDSDNFFGDHNPTGTNKDNAYAFGLSVESNPIGDLQVRASSYTGINYKSPTGLNNTPLGFSGMVGWRYDITNTISFTPHTAMDVAFARVDDDPFGTYRTENSFGFDIVWPGSNGWGDNPLINKETNIFAGLTVDAIVWTKEFEDPTMHFSVSLHEDNAGGLIPNLGTTFVYEIKNLIAPSVEGDPQMFYGVFVDYNLWNQFRPYTRINRTTSNAGTKADEANRLPLQTEIGLEITVIPHTIITLKYQSADFIDVVQKSDSKGLFTSAFIVTF